MFGSVSIRCDASVRCSTLLSRAIHLNCTVDGPRRKGTDCGSAHGSGSGQSSFSSFPGRTWEIIISYTLYTGREHTWACNWEMIVMQGSAKRVGRLGSSPSICLPCSKYSDDTTICWQQTLFLSNTRCRETGTQPPPPRPRRRSEVWF